MAKVMFQVSVDDVADHALIARFRRACPEASISYLWVDGAGTIHVDVPLWALKVCLIAFAASSNKYPYNAEGKRYLVELESFLQNNHGAFQPDLN